MCECKVPSSLSLRFRDKMATQQLSHSQSAPNLATTKQKKKHKFTPGKMLDADSAGANFFKDSKVGSTRGYITVAGTILGIPHKRRTRPPSDHVSLAPMATEYMHQFRERPYCYCSMDKKPLRPYDPLDYRSRIAIEDIPVPYKNASIVDFNEGIHTCMKKRFNTQHRTFYTGEPCDPRTNQGILAENQIFRKSLQGR